MKSKRIHHCEIKRYRQIAPQLCAVCPRILKCRSFRSWYQSNKSDYLSFVLNIVAKFPDKYELEVLLMAEKQSFVQIVDMTSGKIEKIVNLSEIDAMSAEEKLALSRNKNLFVVTHRLEPIVKVEMKKTVISSEILFSENVSEVAVEPEPEPDIPAPKPKGRKKS